MYYKGGQEARLGDTVRGKGYNEVNEIQGVVVSLTPGASSCNLMVAITKPGAIGMSNVSIMTINSPGGGVGVAYIGLEYGQTDQFELVQRSLYENKA